MLPILRILPVGGVLLAILILVLALSPPDGSRAPLSSAMATGRGVLADRDRQSEVRQYLIHAALKRADELNRLRDLPDTPPRAEEAPPKVAGLPATGQTPIRKKPRRSPRRRSSPSRSRSANPLRSNCRPSRRRRCHSRRRKRNRPLPRKPSRPNRGRMRAVASTAPARTHGSRPSRPSLASTISSRCFSGDRRVNNRRTAPRRRAAAKPNSSRPTRSNTSNPRMAASSSIISGL